jgi:hypothetical protein
MKNRREGDLKKPVGRALEGRSLLHSFPVWLRVGDLNRVKVRPVPGDNKAALMVGSR